MFPDARRKPGSRRNRSGVVAAEAAPTGAASQARAASPPAWPGTGSRRRPGQPRPAAPARPVPIATLPRRAGLRRHHLRARNAVVQRLVVRRRQRQQVADVERQPGQRAGEMAARRAHGANPAPALRGTHAQAQRTLAWRGLSRRGFPGGEPDQRQRRDQQQWRQHGGGDGFGQRARQCGLLRIGQPLPRQRQRRAPGVQHLQHRLRQRAHQRIERVGNARSAGAYAAGAGRQHDDRHQHHVQRPGRIAAQQAGRRGLHAAHASSAASFSRFGTIMRAAMIPASYSRHIGIASINCETTSGGVMTAARMNTPTIE
jgi:hypothetical protein